MLLHSLVQLAEVRASRSAFSQNLFIFALPKYMRFLDFSDSKLHKYDSSLQLELNPRPPWAYCVIPGDAIISQDSDIQREGRNCLVCRWWLSEGRLGGNDPGLERASTRYPPCSSTSSTVDKRWIHRGCSLLNTHTEKWHQQCVLMPGFIQGFQTDCPGHLQQTNLEFSKHVQRTQHTRSKPWFNI